MCMHTCLVRPHTTPRTCAGTPGRRGAGASRWRLASAVARGPAACGVVSATPTPAASSTGAAKRAAVRCAASPGSSGGQLVLCPLHRVAATSPPSPTSFGSPASGRGGPPAGDAVVAPRPVSCVVQKAEPVCARPGLVDGGRAAPRRRTDQSAKGGRRRPRDKSHDTETPPAATDHHRPRVRPRALSQMLHVCMHTRMYACVRSTWLPRSSSPLALVAAAPAAATTSDHRHQPNKNARPPSRRVPPLCLLCYIYELIHILYIPWCSPSSRPPVAPAPTTKTRIVPPARAFHRRTGSAEP